MSYEKQIAISLKRMELNRIHDLERYVCIKMGNRAMDDVVHSSSWLALQDQKKGIQKELDELLKPEEPKFHSLFCKCGCRADEEPQETCIIQPHAKYPEGKCPCNTPKEEKCGCRNASDVCWADKPNSVDICTCPCHQTQEECEHQWNYGIVIPKWCGKCLLRPDKCQHAWYSEDSWENQRIEKCHNCRLVRNKSDEKEFREALIGFLEMTMIMPNPHETGNQRLAALRKRFL